MDGPERPSTGGRDRMDTVDVAIVGGGPAGAMAGAAAARRGAETIIFEKGVPRADREELGPDSTDAAGMLDYWVDILGIPFAEIPDDIVLRQLQGSEFIGPTHSVTLYSTGMEASYDGFGFTFHRARMDDWLRKRAESAGAEYRIGARVVDVTSELREGHRHQVQLGDGSVVAARYLICADGPQRTVTMQVLDQFLPSDRSAEDVLGPRETNHVAYQEYREFPDAVFEPEMLKFWWGHIPGETAYPWVFPNDGRVARVGLTMPMAIDLDTVLDRAEYPLLRPEDATVPDGALYLRRLLEQEYGDEYDIEADFPLVPDRGKQGGQEAYAISSTRPIESPAAAGVAIVGGAMGSTSAFHEGGYHVAARTGSIAGRLAAEESLGRYNAAWQREIGEEILRNVSVADLVKDYTPADWDRTFDIASRMVAGHREDGDTLLRKRATAGLGALKLLAQYRWTKFGYRRAGYVQLPESAYEFRR